MVNVNFLPERRRGEKYTIFYSITSVSQSHKMVGIGAWILHSPFYCLAFPAPGTPAPAYTVHIYPARFLFALMIL